MKAYIKMSYYSDQTIYSQEYFYETYIFNN